MIRAIKRQTDLVVINLDKLAYAGSLESLLGVTLSRRYSNEETYLCGGQALARVFE